MKNHTFPRCMTGMATEVNKSPAGTSQHSIWSIIMFIGIQAHRGPLLLHWKYWEDFYCKENRIRGQFMQDTVAMPCHQLLGRALQCLKWGCFLIADGKSIVRPYFCFYTEEVLLCTMKRLRNVKHFKRIRLFNYYTQIWCKYLSVCVREHKIG